MGRHLNRTLRYLYSVLQSVLKLGSLVSCVAIVVIVMRADSQSPIAVLCRGFTEGC